MYISEPLSKHFINLSLITDMEISTYFKYRNLTLKPMEFLFCCFSQTMERSTTSHLRKTVAGFKNINFKKDILLYSF